MARLTLAALAGVLIGIIGGAALGIKAQTEPDDATVALANDVGVEPIDLLGAANTTGLTPRAYLVSVGLLAQPPSSVAVFGCNGSCARDYIASHSRYPARAVCVARIESNFDGRAWNPVPVGRQHAAGYFGWLPSTAASVGVQIGELVSETQGFDRMLDRGRGREYFGISAGRC